MQNVAFYVRVSGREQAENGNLEIQLRDINKWIADHPELNVVGVYQEPGETGTLPLEKRTAGSALLRDAHRGKFDTLIVWKLDRLTRAKTDLEFKLILHEFSSLGITIASLKEPHFRMDTEEDELVATLLGYVSRKELGNILLRTRAGIQKAASEGKWACGVYPYGYTRENGLLVPYEPEAEVVRWMFNEYVRVGKSLNRVTDALNDRGVPSPYGSRGQKNGNKDKKWSRAAVSFLLRNPVYKGEKEHLGHALAVSPLVSVELWEEAAVKRAKNKCQRPGPNPEYILSGLIYCGRCGKPLVGMVGGSKKRPIRYYRCSSKASDPIYRAAEPCKGGYIRAAELEAKVWQEILWILDNPEEALGEVAARESETKERLEKVDAELREVERDILRRGDTRREVIRLKADRLITDDDLRLQLSDLADEVQALEGRRDKLRVEQAALVEQARSPHKIRQMLEEFREEVEDIRETATLAERRWYTETLVSRIVVKDGKALIEAAGRNSTLENNRWTP